MGKHVKLATLQVLKLQMLSGPYRESLCHSVMHDHGLWEGLQTV